MEWTRTERFHITHSQLVDFRVTYPVGSDLQGREFQNNDKQFVSWQAPGSIQQVNVTLVDAAQNAVAVVKVVDAYAGTTGEIPVSFGNGEPGEYHFHLAGIGGPACQADSGTFKMVKTQEHDDVYDEKAWRHALQDVGDYVDDKDDHKNEYFTNEDHRTHLNDQIIHELDEISSSHNDVGQWQAEEVAVEAEPKHEDDIDSLFDHSNAATWSEEELDPKHTDVQGFQAEEHDDDASVHYVTDYSSVGQWQEEQIEESEATGHQDADGWVEDVSKFDHTDSGSWHEDEVSLESTEQHDDVVEWQAEVVDVTPEPKDDGSHINEGQWVDDDDDDEHDDAAAWIAEELDEEQVSNHKNEGPELESDPEWHMDVVPTGVEWAEEEDDVAHVADHTDAAPFIEEEIEHLDEAESWSEHSDAAENWYEEVAHNDQAPTGKAVSGRIGETHSNDVTPEALIAKW
ncbi:hypothetical protein BJV82DRAFT_156161 [Fennellomyces sp. T-0311]|nr:hypothetical protein BJV82DRAFT_156161 [Fennellomyces sp. T-0311]